MKNLIQLLLTFIFLFHLPGCDGLKLEWKTKGKDQTIIKQPYLLH